MGVSYLAKKYLWDDKDTSTPSPQDKLAEQMNQTLSTLQSQNSELRDLLRDNLRSSSTVSPPAMREKAEMAELRAELKTMKAMVMDMKATSKSPITPPWLPSSDAKPTLPSWLTETPSSTSASHVKKSTQPSPTPLPTPSPSSEKPSPSSPSPSSQADEPERPKDFSKIMEMVQSGQKPDDVKDIDDSPTGQTISKGSREAPLKPYQRKALEQTNSTTANDLPASSKMEQEDFTSTPVENSPEASSTQEANP